MIVDEAHNSRTELAFDMLARFRPSGVMELDRHARSGAHTEQRAAQRFRRRVEGGGNDQATGGAGAEPNWQQCLADAIGRRDALHKLADDEGRTGADYLRPLVLIQSEPRRKGVDTLDFDRVRNELIANHGIPASEITVATGGEKGLEQIDANYKLGIADPTCPVKFIITQRALAEGWDCPFAYMPGQHGLAVVRHGGGAAVGPRIAATRCQPSARKGAESIICLRGVAQLCGNCQQPAGPTGGGRRI